MGREIFHCFGCEVRLTPSEITSGKAILYDNQYACHECAVELGLIATPAPPPPRKTTRRKGTNVQRAESPKHGNKSGARSARDSARSTSWSLAASR